MEIKLVVDDTVNNNTVNQSDEDQKEIGRSIVFVNNETSEAVVAIRGTMPYEWRDNFLGGAPTSADDKVSTEDQEQALAWYQSLNLEEEGYENITVIGHSKGGNKAMYITLMDASVSRCVSFDGQGFSDEFMKRYEEEIRKRQDKISNHCVEDDYVNLLLNSVGTQIYYQGYGYGKGGFLEAHCPNTFFDFEYVGEKCYVHMKQVNGPVEEMVVLNEFLNSYLRSLPALRRMEVMDVLGTVVESGFGVGWWTVPIVLNIKGGWDEIIELLDYATDYAVVHPELFGVIGHIAERYNIPEWIIDPMLKAIRGLTISSEIFSGRIFFNDLFWGGSVDNKDFKHYVLLEQNRVFDINKLTALGTTGKALMDTGGFVCKVWDAAVADLKDLYDCLPGEVKSSLLENSLDGLSRPFYNDEYDIMANKIYNTTYNIVENIPPKDEEAAQLIDEITTELSNVISIIKTMEENLVVSPM